jgi:hypothetical protein
LSNEDEVLGLGDKLEVGKCADLFGVDAGLPFEGEGFNGPRFGQSGLFDPPRQGGLLPMMVLRAEEPSEEGAVRELVLLGMRQLVVHDGGNLLQVEIPQQLLDLVGHDSGSSSPGAKRK